MRSLISFAPIAVAIAATSFATAVTQAATVNFNFDEGEALAQSITYSGATYAPFTLKLTAGLGATSYSPTGTDGVNVFRGSGSVGVQNANSLTSMNQTEANVSGSLGRQISGGEVLWLTFSPAAIFNVASFVLDGANENAVFYSKTGTVLTPVVSGAGGFTYKFTNLVTDVIGIGYNGSSVTGTDAGIKLDSISVATVPVPPAIFAGMALFGLLGGKSIVRRFRAE